MEEKLHHYLSECGNKYAGHHMRFEVLMAMNTKIKVIWDTIHVNREMGTRSSKEHAASTFKTGQGKMLLQNVGT